LRPLPRAAAFLAALLVVANCSAVPGPAQISRNASASEPIEAEVAAARTASAGEVTCLAEAIYFEARGTGTAGESAVAHVVVNRAMSPKFGPRTVCGVVADGCQFSYRCDGRPDVLSDPASRAKAFRVAETVLAGAPDITKGALFFHTAGMAPGWFATRPRVGTFGGNVFYR